jgi:septal ring-binding cell division protein DamX
MRFEIGPGGIFIILLGLAGLSGGVFGLGLVAGHELAGPEPGSQPVAAAYPLPQTAPASAASSASPVEASIPAANAPAASTGSLPAAPPIQSAGARPNSASVNPAVTSAGAALNPAVEAPLAQSPSSRTVESKTAVASRTTRPAAAAPSDSDEDLSTGSAVAPPPATRSASTEPPASATDEGDDTETAPPSSVQPPHRRMAAVNPSTPRPASGPYSVQIDAMMDWQGAQQMAQKIRAKGFQPYIVPTYVDGKTWYRLRVGHYASPEQAQAAESRLHEDFNQ